MGYVAIENSTKTYNLIKGISILYVLGGGFEYFLFSSLLGGMIQFD